MISFIKGEKVIKVIKSIWLPTLSLLILITGCTTLGSTNWNQAFVISGNESQITSHVEEFGPLFSELFSFSHTGGFLSMIGLYCFFLFVCLVWVFLSHLDLLIYFRSLSCCITQLCLSSTEWTLWSSGWVVDGFRGKFGQFVDFGSRHGSLESQSFRNSFVTLSKLIDVTDFISQPFLQIMAW